jgi:mannose-6-phosphate isomerase-like protein (cupin superfamily)
MRPLPMRGGPPPLTPYKSRVLIKATLTPPSSGWSIMPSRLAVAAIGVVAGVVGAALATSCFPAHSVHEPYADAGCGTKPVSRVLGESEGERRVRRPPPNSSLPGLAYTAKVDCESVGSTDLFLSYEELMAGGPGIGAHRHPHMDEILIIRHGAGIVSLDGVETPVTDGGMVYIARNSIVRLRNTGSGPLSIAFIFPHTGYGTYLREWSVPTGQLARPLTDAENATKQARARWLQVLEP